jgi:hypothetical protein
MNFYIIEARVQTELGLIQCSYAVNGNDAEDAKSKFPKRDSFTITAAILVPPGTPFLVALHIP